MLGRDIFEGDAVFLLTRISFLAKKSIQERKSGKLIIITKNQSEISNFPASLIFSTMLFFCGNLPYSADQSSRLS